MEVLQLPTYTFGGIGSELAPPRTGTAMTARYEDFYTFEPGMTVKEKLAYVEEHFRMKSGPELLPRYR